MQAEENEKRCYERHGRESEAHYGMTQHTAARSKTAQNDAAPAQRTAKRKRDRAHAENTTIIIPSAWATACALKTNPLLSLWRTA